jgi:hypothetical protein
VQEHVHGGYYARPPENLSVWILAWILAMKMNRFGHFVAIAAATAVLVVGCTKSGNDTSVTSRRPAALAASLGSMQSSEATKAKLQAAGWTNWRVIESPSTQPPKNRPPLQILTMEADGSDLDVVGTLRLEFLNDQLMATWFYPKDLARYRSALEKEAKRDELTSIKYGTDYQKRDYVLWEDVRLRKELDDWIRKYS